VDEAQPVEHRALVHRIRPEEAINVTCAQIGHHFRRRDNADLHISIRIKPGFGEVIAQQIVVHREIEG